MVGGREVGSESRRMCVLRGVERESVCVQLRSSVCQSIIFIHI